MVKRVKFRKGQQRKFLKQVLDRMNCPSLRELISRGFDVPYSTLKNYYNESRNLPENLFSDLCNFSGIDKSKLKFELLDENWGQVRGGKKGRR